MPTAEDEVLIAEIVYEYLGRLADLEIGQTLKLTVEQKAVLVILAGTFDTRRPWQSGDGFYTDFCPESLWKSCFLRLRILIIPGIM